MYVCMYVYMYVYMCIYLYVCMYVCVHIFNKDNKHYAEQLLYITELH